MSRRSEILNKEKTIIENFFNRKFIDFPDLPAWITEDRIQFWQANLFYIHYLPKFSLDEDLKLPLWQDRPSKIFYKKIREGSLKKEAKILPGKWLLIDGRDKPEKRVPWIRVNDVWLLEKMGLNPKNYLKKWNKQLHESEYLIETLRARGFGSRFCLTIQEINDLKPFILNFLKIEQTKTIRLPFFAEYNYLGNAIYKQWRKTETWEWFEDRLNTGQYLAGGSRSLGDIGWEAPEFWSTILTFRPVVELGSGL
jgi:hypothetical protein